MIDYLLHRQTGNDIATKTKTKKIKNKMRREDSRLTVRPYVLLYFLSESADPAD